MGDAVVRCGNCYISLEDDTYKVERIPCPQCGSLVRQVEINVYDEGTAHEKIRLTAKRPGIKRPIKEVISGDEFQISRKKWSLLERVFDRENDNYYEKVVDIETGEVYHECNEPLSEHLNHGSAKKKSD